MCHNIILYNSYYISYISLIQKYIGSIQVLHNSLTKERLLVPHNFKLFQSNLNCILNPKSILVFYINHSAECSGDSDIMNNTPL